MAINIKNPSVQAAARELAERRGQSLTSAVGQAVQEALERERIKRAPGVVNVPLRQRLEAIAQRVALRPDLDSRSAEEICGYDNNGLPG
jgi:antitoxin VapB